MAPKESSMVRAAVRDPFAMLRQMTSEFERLFAEPGWPVARWPFRAQFAENAGAWFPQVDVFEKDGRLVTKIDLPGMTKNDVKVEATDGMLTISGERKSEAEEKKDDYYRCERSYGRFERAVPLPEGAKLEDVRATFADGVLEVSVPLPAKAAPAVKKVNIEDGATATKAA